MNREREMLCWILHHRDAYTYDYLRFLSTKKLWHLEKQKDYSIYWDRIEKQSKIRKK